MRKIILVLKKGIKKLKLIKSFLRISTYKRGGCIPWSKGYGEYKWKSIDKALNNDELIAKFSEHKELPKNYGYGLDERIVEYPWIFSQIPKEEKILLDAGSTLNYPPTIHHKLLKNKKITVVNLNPEPHCFYHDGVSYLFSDIRKLPLKDSLFDVITCISTLEHVGMDNTSVYQNELKYQESKIKDYILAVIELLRVLKPGGILLITVPFGKYENHNFFQQFNSEMIEKIENSSQGRFSANYYHYNKDGWNIVRGSEILKENSYFDVRAHTKPHPDLLAAAEAVACLKITKPIQSFNETI